jgi:hypothetical protein
MHIRKYNFYVQHVYIWQMYHDIRIKHVADTMSKAQM